MPPEYRRAIAEGCFYKGMCEWQLFSGDNNTEGTSSLHMGAPQCPHTA